MTVRGYQIAADWGRLGTFTGPYDDVTSDVDGGEVVVSWGRDQATATSRPTAGKAGFALNNLDRRYSYENSASPLAGRVVSGTPCRVQTTYQGAITTLHDGVADTIEADPDSAARTVTVESVDAWGLLSTQTLSTPLYQGIRTGTAIGLILDAAGWTGPRDLDAGVTCLPWWWAEGISAADAVDVLLRSEGPPSAAYVECGTFVFRDRHHRLLRSTSTTSQGVWTHIIPAGSGPAGDHKIGKKSFKYDHGLNNIANAVNFAVPVRAPTDTEVVWSSEDAITVATGQSVAVTASAENPFLNAVTPEPGTDYTVASGTVTVTLSRTSGQAATITITASADAVITRMALRAVPVPVARTVRVAVEDTTSISTFGRRVWPEADVGLASPYDAQAIAQRTTSVYGQPRPTMTFSFAYAPGGAIPERYLGQMLARRVGDRITVRNDAIGFNSDVYIERITHTIHKLGLIHRVEYGCSQVEPSQPASVFTFDTAGRGFNDGLFAVDGIDNPSTMFVFDVAGQGFNDGLFAN